MSSDAILYCGIVPYDTIRQRPQWLADGLQEHAPLLYVEPTNSILRGKRGRSRRSSCGPRGALLDPGMALPLSGRMPALNRANYGRVARLCKSALQELDWSPAWILASFPKHLDLLPHFPGVPVIYDVMDDYPQFFHGLEQRNLARMHARLLERADYVVASSRVLAESCKSGARRAPVVIENAAAACMFESVSEELRAEFKKPCFGYVGALAEWLDYEAIIRLAEQYPQGSVVLVGPRHTQLPPMPANVQILGERPHSELPRLLQGMDVGLVPFQVSAATNAVNPVKVYEYLASGLPVLATPCTELQRFANSVRIAPSAQWPQAAAELLAMEHDPDAIRQAVRGETWEQRIEQLWELMSHCHSSADAALPGGG